MPRVPRDQEALISNKDGGDMDNREKAKREYLNGKSMKEIADELGIKDSTVRAWKRRDKWSMQRNISATKEESVAPHDLKTGAKGKFEYWISKDGLLLLSAWARDGFTDEQMAEKMSISPSTLYAWKAKYSEISEALTRGKEIVDIEVENSLLKKANGYNAPVVKTFKLKEVYYDEEGRRCEKEHLESVADEVHIPADTSAIAIWLSNRKPDKWRKNANKDKLDEDKFDYQKEMDERNSY